MRHFAGAGLALIIAVWMKVRHHEFADLSLGIVGYSLVVFFAFVRYAWIMRREGREP